MVEELLVTALRRGQETPLASAVGSVAGSVVRMPWGVSSRAWSTRGTGRRVLEQAQVARSGSNGFPFGLFDIPAILFGLFCLFVAIHTPSYTPTPAGAHGRSKTDMS